MIHHLKTEFIKMSFITFNKESKKEGLITANIFDGKAMIKFDNQEQMRFTHNSLVRSGKKAFLSRGLVIQLFRDENQENVKKEEIKDIFKKDIEAGVQGAGKLKREIIIKDYKEELIK